MIERVIERAHLELRAVAKARVVGSDQMILVGKKRDEVPEHVRRGGKSVQQQKGRILGASGFSVKDLKAVDVGRPIVSLAGGRWLRGHYNDSEYGACLSHEIVRSGIQGLW